MIRLDIFKDKYRSWRMKLRKSGRRIQGDLEAVLFCRHPSRAKLKRMRNRHVGRVAFLIGNGPSVRIEDIEMLHRRLTFCCNRFYLAYDRTALRPTYLCSADPLMIRDFGLEMIARAETRVVFMSVENPSLPGDYDWVEIDSERPFAFTTNVLKPLHPGGGTLIAALQVGYWMGIRHFILYGVDHNFQKLSQTLVGTDGKSQFVTGEGNHFISNYRAGKTWVAPWTSTIEEAFRKSDAALRAAGGWLVNASRNTNLPDIDRVPFEEALAMAHRIEKCTDVE